MSSHAYFRVDPRLASLLGKSYRSTEQALRELVDNAWDADAENVSITLPQPLTGGPIIVADDGTGMTEDEVRRQYLMIANDRYSRRGTKTAKGRLIRGRKGIGKFAGLVAAEEMRVETWSGGQKTTLNVSKSALKYVVDTAVAVKLVLNRTRPRQSSYSTSMPRRFTNLWRQTCSRPRSPTSRAADSTTPAPPDRDEFHAPGEQSISGMGRPLEPRTKHQATFLRRRPHKPALWERPRP